MNAARTAAAIFAFAFVIHRADAKPVRSLDALKGAVVWFAEDHTVPIIVLEASLPAGSVNDPADRPGLANFAGAMLDEGAGAFDARAYNDILADHAVELSVDTERDFLKITLRCETEDAGKAFQLLGLALRRPRFDSDAVQRVRVQLLQAVDEDDQDPDNIAEKTFNADFFLGHPYAHTPSGEKGAIAAISVPELKSFARSHWVRGGARIAMSGDVTAAGAVALLKSAFGSLPANNPLTPPVWQLGKPGVKEIPLDAAEPAVEFGVPALPRTDRNYLASLVANDILGGDGFTSRLTAELRVRRGLTYDVSTRLIGYRRYTLIQGRLATRRAVLSQTVAALRAVFGQFAQSGPTDREFADAKTHLIDSFPLKLASESGLVSQLSEFQRQGLGLDYLEKRNSEISAVTIAAVRQVSRQLFDPSRLLIVIAGSAGNPPRTSRD